MRITGNPLDKADSMSSVKRRELLAAVAGIAHGASVHQELVYLVKAGLTPIQALRCATSVPARRFELRGRGRIAPGLRADLVLVDGDPTSNITDTLSIRRVWKHGVELLQGRPS